MAIKSQGGLDSCFLHRDKGNTVRQRIHFVGMLFKVFPCLIKQFLANMDKLNGRAAHETVYYFDRLGVPIAAVKKGGNFIDDIRCGDKRGERF